VLAVPLNRSALLAALVLSSCTTRAELPPSPAPQDVEVQVVPSREVEPEIERDPDLGLAFMEATDDLVRVSGRAERTARGSLRFGYPGVSTLVHFDGTSLVARLSSSTGDNALDIRIDGEFRGILWLEREARDVAVATGLGPGRHKVELTHRTETRLGVVEVERFALPDGGRFLAPPEPPEHKLLVIGASVACGENVARGPACEPGHPSPASWDARATYGMVTAQALDAEVNLVCYGGKGLMRDWRGDEESVNGPQLFDLAVPDEEGSAPWDHARFQPHAVVVSLGNNDFNRDLPSNPNRERFVSAYVSFLSRIRDVHPEAHVFVTEGPMVRDEGEGPKKRKTLLRKYIQAAIQQFGDERVRFIAAAEQPGDSCDPHPTRGQHLRIAAALVPEIRGALDW
jgi:hypothetical protein